MAEKHFDDQLDDEEVLYVFRKHPIVMRRGLIYAMVAILLGIVPALIKPEYSYFFGGLAAGVVLAGIVFFPSWINWFYSVFIVTDQRFVQITQRGLFHRSVSDLGLHHIQTVNYEVAGLEQTILGFGTIVVQTYMGDLVLHNIHHPAQTQKKIVSIIKEQGIITDSNPYVDSEDTEYDEET